MSAPFEWITVEDEGEWQALSLPPAPTARRSAWQHRRAPWLWALLALLLLSAGGGVYALERAAQTGWDQIEAELRSAVAADAWAARPAGAAAPPAVQVVQTQAQGAMQAIVQSVVTQTLASGETVAYRTTGVYRASAEGLQRVAPGSAQRRRWRRAIFRSTTLPPIGRWRGRWPRGWMPSTSKPAPALDCHPARPRTASPSNCPRTRARRQRTFCAAQTDKR